MSKKVQIPLAVIMIAAWILGLRATTVWGQAPGTETGLTNSVSTAGFLLLLPLGIMLLTSSAFPRADQDSPPAATTAFVAWTIAVLAYFGAGFAFQFGGLAIGNPHPDFAELYWNWSPLDASFGTGWGVIGLRGWALLGAAATPGVYDLFLRHIALLGVVTTIPSFILHRRLSTFGLLVFGLLAGTLIYPVVGNWIWSDGWLSNLGETLGLGHGFVDAGIATPFALAGGICLAALMVFKESDQLLDGDPEAVEAETFVSIPMPAAHLPLLSFAGLIMILWSWAFIAGAAHIPTAAPIAMPRAALNGILSALASGLGAALYSRFTTTQFNPLMFTRGAVAGLVVASTVAPFIPPWQAIVIGIVSGGLTPLFIYLVDHFLRLVDHTSAVATFGLMGLLAWLLPGLLADGSSGVGWNNLGETTYLGLEGQGVSGLFVASGYVSDWPGQFNAQVLGAAAIIGWTFLLAFSFFRGWAWLSNRDQNLKSADAPAPAESSPLEAEIANDIEVEEPEQLFTPQP